MNANEKEVIKKEYALSDNEFEEMYQQAKTLIIGKCKPAKETPMAIITGGQPGAGKIGLVLKSKREMKEKGKDTVIIDSDSYRGLYKRSIEIAARYPELYSEITDRATGKITNRLLNEVIDGGYNFIFEGILGKINIVNSLQNAPREYEVTARLIATSKEESLLSIFERYIVMLENMQIGRLTTIEAHNTRYDNFTNIAKILEDRGIETEVYERGKDIEHIGYPKMIYKTSANNNMYKTVEDALNAGRIKSFKLCESNIKTRLKEINNSLRDLSYKNPEIKEELEKLNEIFSQITINDEER